MLRFFGRGSGFSDDHNGAYFTVGRSLVLVDCPLVTFRRLKNEGLTRFFNIANPVDIIPDDKNESVDITSDSEVSDIIIVITHTHSDHIGGLSLTIHYATFVWKKHVTVVAPSEAGVQAAACASATFAAAPVPDCASAATAPSACPSAVSLMILPASSAIILSAAAASSVR